MIYHYFLAQANCILFPNIICRYKLMYMLVEQKDDHEYWRRKISTSLDFMSFCCVFVFLIKPLAAECPVYQIPYYAIIFIFLIVLMLLLVHFPKTVLLLFAIQGLLQLGLVMDVSDAILSLYRYTNIYIWKTFC